MCFSFINLLIFVEDCWAIVLTRLLQAVYNINNQYPKDFLYKEKPRKGNHIWHLGILKNEGLLKKKVSGQTKAGSKIGNKEKWEFTTLINAQVDFVKRMVDESPVGIVFDLDHEFYQLTKGTESMNSEQVRIERHMLLIVGNGYTKEGKMFFIVQNSWGKDNWGVQGYGRIIIDDKSNFLR